MRPIDAGMLPAWVRRVRLSDIAEIAGVTLVSAGAGLAWLPAGLIVGGLGLIGLAVAAELSP